MSAEVIRLTHADSGAEAHVLVSQGFNCFSWKAPLKQGLTELLYATDGFETGQGRASSSGIPLLFPFPGRIAGGRFTFQGKDYKIPAGDGRVNALHGFVFTRPWRTIDSSPTQVTAEFQGSVDAPETLELWPSDYLIRASYELEPHRLVCRVRYENPGEGDLPCGFGTHAYFKVPIAEGADVEDTVLTIPTDGEWEFVEMIPSGKCASTPAADQFPHGLKLAGQQFDSGYRLKQGASGTIETSVKSGPVTVTQTCDADFQCYVVYTPGHREAVCVEPYTNVPDPFALLEKGVDSNLQVLSPGESRDYELVLAVSEG